MFPRVNTMGEWSWRFRSAVSRLVVAPPGTSVGPDSARQAQADSLVKVPSRFPWLLAAGSKRCRWQDTDEH